MKTSSIIVLQATILALLSSALPAMGADHWPQFRGPGGQGQASATGLPTTWSETENIHWKTPIAGLGWSSPVVYGDRIWLTTSVDDQQSLRLVCLARETGAVLYDVEVFRADDLGRIAAKNSHASPTPVVDGRHVFVHFGAHGTACLTVDGQIVWTRRLEYDHRHGPGGSPVLSGRQAVRQLRRHRRAVHRGAGQSDGRSALEGRPSGLAGLLDSDLDQRRRPAATDHQRR